MSPNSQMYETVTSRILESLERGTVPWRLPWNAGYGAPQNLAGRPYRGINVLLLSLQGFGDPRWGTFRAVKNAGGHVRKGEKGTSIILWKPVRKQVLNEAGELEAGGYMLLRGYTVFNAEQCEGLPELERPADFEPEARAEEILEGMPGRPPIVYGGPAAAYSPEADRVYLPEREAFSSPAAFYTTAFHELTHAAGHEKRCGGLEPATFGSDPYAREELIAELGAAMLAGVAGIVDETLEASAAYLENWKRRLEDNPRLIIQAAANAQRRADHIQGVKWAEDTASPAEDLNTAASERSGELLEVSA